jgi:hypothetical protein
MIEKYQNLRGGVLYSALRIAPTTVHSWPIAIGKSRGDGHRRYDVVDATILLAMKHLTAGWGMKAGPAANIAKHLRIVDDLDRRVGLFFDRLAETNEHSFSGGPFVIVTKIPRDGAPTSEFMHLAFDSASVALGLDDPRSGEGALVIPLGRLIAKAVYQIGRVLAGEVIASEAE